MVAETGHLRGRRLYDVDPADRIVYVRRNYTQLRDPVLVANWWGEVDN